MPAKVTVIVMSPTGDSLDPQFESEQRPEATVSVSWFEARVPELLE
jgi:hypothetical protein